MIRQLANKPYHDNVITHLFVFIRETFMKHLLMASLAALALTACGDTTVAGSSVKNTVTRAAGDVMATKTKAVLLYASWCGSCKVLDPAVSKAQAMGPLPGVEFIVLDYTDKDDANFYAQAEAAGVETAVRSFLDGRVKTGMLLLVDVDDEKVITKITNEDGAPEILAKIKAAVSAS